MRKERLKKEKEVHKREVKHKNKRELNKEVKR